MGDDWVGLNVLADLFQLASVFFECCVEPLVRHAITKQQFNGLQGDSVIFPAIDAHPPEVGGEQQFSSMLVRAPELFTNLRSANKHFPELIGGQTYRLDASFGLAG